LDDLTLVSVEALKVSFSYIDGSTEDYYNIFILKVESGTTSIIRYFYDATSGAAGVNYITAGNIDRHYSLTLSTKTNTLFRDKLD